MGFTTIDLSPSLQLISYLIDEPDVKGHLITDPGKLTVIMPFDWVQLQQACNNKPI